MAGSDGEKATAVSIMVADTNSLCFFVEQQINNSQKYVEDSNNMFAKANSNAIALRMFPIIIFFVPKVGSFLFLFRNFFIQKG